MARMKLLILTLSVSLAASAQTCKKGEYLTLDGRCLHDQTGENHPAGDGCNTATCMDAACHLTSVTAMGCLHGDDPAPVTTDDDGPPNPATHGEENATTFKGSPLPTWPICEKQKRHWWSRKRTGCWQPSGDPIYRYVWPNDPK